MKSKMMVFALCCLPLCAHAQWETTVKPEPMSDLENATMLNTENMAQSIIVDCESGGLGVSYIEHYPQQPGEHIDPYKTFPMQLKVGKEKLDFSEVNVERRNSEYIAFKAVDYLETRHALYMLYNAKGPITMGVKAGSQMSDVTLSSTGSSKAAAKMAKACDVDLTYKVWEDLK